MKKLLSKNQKSVIRLILAAMLLLGSAVSVMWAVNNPLAVASDYRAASRVLSRYISKLSGIFPFSLVEVAIILAVLGAVVAVVFLVIRLCRKKERLKRIFAFFSALMLIISCLVSAFLSVWGLNYFAIPISQELGLEVVPRAAGELFEVTEYLLEMTNQYAQLVERDSELNMLETDLGTLSALCCEAYDRLEEDYACQSGGRAKGVMNWYTMSKLGISGIYIPYTAECNINMDIIPAQLPFTVAHEMAHRAGYAPENEANFVAYLVLRESEDNRLLYSAYYTAFVYCYNATARIDSTKATEFFIRLDEAVVADIVAADQRYQKYAGPLREMSSKVNDTYLKVMRQESGVQSYGEVVDLIIADYFQ